MEFLGFGRESTPGASAEATKFFPFIASGDEQCELCSAVRPRAAMAVVACDIDDGSSRYACSAHLIEETAFVNALAGLEAEWNDMGLPRR